MNSQANFFNKSGVKIVSALYGLCKNINIDFDLNTMEENKFLYLFDIDNRLLATINKSDAQHSHFSEIEENIFS